MARKLRWIPADPGPYRRACYELHGIRKTSFCEVSRSREGAVFPYGYSISDGNRSWGRTGSADSLALAQEKAARLLVEHNIIRGQAEIDAVLAPIEENLSG